MKCETCGHVFGGVTAFDMHRVGQFEKGHMRDDALGASRRRVTGDKASHRAAKRVHGKRRQVYVVDSANTRRCLTTKEMEAKGLVYTAGKWCQRYGAKAA